MLPVQNRLLFPHRTEFATPRLKLHFTMPDLWCEILKEEPRRAPACGSRGARPGRRTCATLHAPRRRATGARACAATNAPSVAARAAGAGPGPASLARAASVAAATAIAARTAVWVLAAQSGRRPAGLVRRCAPELGRDSGGHGAVTPRPFTQLAERAATGTHGINDKRRDTAGGHAVLSSSRSHLTDQSPRGEDRDETGVNERS